MEKGDGATVVLVPQRAEGVALGQTVLCGARVSFELSEVSPGDYYVAAFDHMDGLSPSGRHAQPCGIQRNNVKVEEHSAANVMLSAIVVPR